MNKKFFIHLRDNTMLLKEYKSRNEVRKDHAKEFVNYNNLFN